MQPGLWLPRTAIRLGQQGEPVGVRQLLSHALDRRQPLVELRHAVGSVSARGQGPPPQEAPLLDAQRRSLCGGEGYGRIDVCLGSRYIAAVV